MRQKRKNIGAGTMAVLLFLSSVFLAAPGEARAESIKEENPGISYTALGDSISNGYTGASEPVLTGYPELIAEDLEAMSRKETEVFNFSQNGLTTAKLNSIILAGSETRKQLQKANLVTVTIGANDLMNEFKKVAREILNEEKKFHSATEALEALQKGISENPLLLVKVIGAISDWDYDSFEEEWVTAMDTIKSLKPKDCEWLVTTIYNPVGKMELPGTMNSVVEDIIGEMNDIVKAHAGIYGYQVVDLLDSDIGACTQSDGLHPNQEGQNLIKELVEEEMDIEKVAGIGENAALDADARAKKAEVEARKSNRQEEQQKKADRGQLQMIVLLLLNAGFLGLVVYVYRDRKNGCKE